MSLSVVSGNLLDADTQYIAHQCNCITVKGAHLSADVFARFPHANIYADRKSGHRDTPGTIIIRGEPDSKDQRLVINMLGQYYPGQSRFAVDTHALRQQWFASCLAKIGEIGNLTSIAFPWNIGCGAAGGDWNRYHEMLQKFATAHPNVRVVLYQLPSIAAAAAADKKQPTLKSFISRATPG